MREKLYHANSMKSILILHDIRSAHNVGSLFRTADALGIDHIYLSSICPLPIDRFGRPRNDITKTALGAQLSVPWESYDDIYVLVEKLKREGIQIITIEQSFRSVDYKTVKINERVAFILGNEVGGLSPDIIELADVVAEIPMKGKKESLNVAVAGGIALARILNV